MEGNLDFAQLGASAGAIAGLKSLLHVEELEILCLSLREDFSEIPKKR